MIARQPLQGAKSSYPNASDEDIDTVGFQAGAGGSRPQVVVVEGYAVFATPFALRIAAVASSTRLRVVGNDR
jgi:hypothetical protein